MRSIAIRIVGWVERSFAQQTDAEPTGSGRRSWWVPRFSAIAPNRSTHPTFVAAIAVCLFCLASTARADDWKALVEKSAEPILKDRAYATIAVGILQDDKEEYCTFGKWDGKTPNRDSISRAVSTARREASACS